MLNRNTYRLLLVSLGLFLMSAAMRTRPVIKNFTDKGAVFTHHTFDSTGLCSCISMLYNDIPSNIPRIKLNEGSQKFAATYLTKNTAGLNKIKLRASSDFQMMDKIFCSLDLPVELKYLAVVESELKSKKVSRAGAAGQWQLMPSTARLLGLKVSTRYDERKLKYKSTKAAATYLCKLHNYYQDWLLTIAAYNCGPGRVNKAIKRSGNRNYWRLQHLLPAETRTYVKKYITVHYYFEGHGGVTTISKQELQRHIRDVCTFIENNNPTKEL